MLLLLPSVMKESMRWCDSGRLKVILPSLRPLTTSNEEAWLSGEVGEVTGDEDGEMAVLILVVRVRRRGILVSYSMIGESC